MKSYIDTKNKIIRNKLEQIVIDQNKETIKINNKKVKEKGIISNLVLLQDSNKDKILKFILKSKEQNKNILYEKSKEKIKTLIKSKEEYEELISFAISLIDY